jgi:hypothetical protein
VLPSPAGRGHAVSRVPCTGSWPARYAPIQQSACTGQRCPFTNHRPSPRAGSDRSQMRHTSGRSMVAPTPRSPHHYQTTVTPPSHQTAGMTEMFTVLQGLHSTCRPEMFRGGRPCAGNARKAFTIFGNRVVFAEEDHRKSSPKGQRCRVFRAWHGACTLGFKCTQCEPAVPGTWLPDSNGPSLTPTTPMRSSISWSMCVRRTGTPAGPGAWSMAETAASSRPASTTTPRATPDGRPSVASRS